MINYSISKRSVTVTDSTGVKTKADKWFAKPQSKGTLTTEEFATMMSSASGRYQSAQIFALICIVAEQLKLQAKDSRKVQLGGLGAFGPALSSEGVMNADDFNPRSHVKKVYLSWDKSSKFSTLRDAKFNLVPTLAIAQAGTKATKNASNVVNVNPEN